jgi:LysM repeat protein
MSRKAFAKVFVIALILLALLAVPGSAQAGGGCGSTYIVQWGDTLDMIAWRCDTTVSALYAANPGISGYLYAGQTLVIPGGGYNYYAPVNYNGTYIVQYGDTFSGIASRYGVSMNDLWTANPYIWNINYVYAGQVIHVPLSTWSPIVSTAAETSAPLSYGTVPFGYPYGKITLSNQANSDVYVSLQGTMRDGYEVINEYPVDGGTMTVKVPIGWYYYVAWVGGQKFEGQFHLNADTNRSIMFYSKKVVVE